jgi:RNA polymerase sigma factor (sigma-70 family)
MEEVSAKTQRKADWTLSEASFSRFLKWLDEGTDSEGRNYIEMRRRLVSYFDRKNCLSPDDLADETLNRVARRLEEEGTIESETPAKYCYTVARYVFLESLRSNQDQHKSIDEVTERKKKEFAAPETNDGKELKEKMLACLEQCTAKLDPQSRDLIIRYYYGKERAKIDNRRAMAEALGISVNALSIRACRIRDRLEECVRKCAGSE